MGDSVYPPRPESGRLYDFWDAQVKDLVLLPTPTLSEEQKERHILYSLVLMALVAHYWNGNKRGRAGTYPWREKQKGHGGEYIGGDYLGHNIASLAVDAQGEIIDFDFNHNEILNSSVEHAESRLVRRVFSLTQLNNGWATSDVTSPTPPVNYSNMLSDVTVYTSLESCSQCSGIMALGSVKEVVFLQRDPGQNSIGNILRKLSPVGATYTAPLPIPADILGLGYFGDLDSRYRTFAQEVDTKPFYMATDGKADKSSSITSFLCTDSALEVFSHAKARFQAIQSASYPDFRPKGINGQVVPNSFTNQDVANHIHRFFEYASIDGRRGTPHKL
jgi:tRNA(Arg) A34 adenosine deaminase TadA